MIRTVLLSLTLLALAVGWGLPDMSATLTNETPADTATVSQGNTTVTHDATVTKTHVGVKVIENAVGSYWEGLTDGENWKQLQIGPGTGTWTLPKTTFTYNSTGRTGTHLTERYVYNLTDSVFLVHIAYHRYTVQ